MPIEGGKKGKEGHVRAEEVRKENNICFENIIFCFNSWLIEMT